MSPADRLAEAENQLRKVTDSHGGTASAIIARYHLGLLNASKKNFDSAKQDFQAVVDSGHPFYWELASAKLGEILELHGNYEGACSVYRRVADSPSTEFPIAYFAWKAGNCLERLGEQQEALRYYNIAKDSDSQELTSTISLEIEKKIKKLSGTRSDTD